MGKGLGCTPSKSNRNPITNSTQSSPTIQSSSKTNTNPINSTQFSPPTQSSSQSNTTPIKSTQFSPTTQSSNTKLGSDEKNLYNDNDFEALLARAQAAKKHQCHKSWATMDP